jgi:hypothetical protein
MMVSSRETTYSGYSKCPPLEMVNPWTCATHQSTHLPIESFTYTVVTRGCPPRNLLTLHLRSGLSTTTLQISTLCRSELLQRFFEQISASVILISIGSNYLPKIRVLCKPQTQTAMLQLNSKCHGIARVSNV